jgi:FkbH-like protein
VALARELACRWLPACTLPPRKAIVVDLDETLYRGVLGEDGVSGVELTDAHLALQQYLKDCAARGAFLALVSRNELVDVQELFAQRSDFPLRLTDFTTMSVAWADKGTALKRIASDLRIASDSMVFVDDNPGELAGVAMSTSALTVHAKPDAARTLDALRHVAGLFRFKQSAEDGLRSADLTANRERDALLEQAGSAEEYLRSLAVRLSYAVSAADDLARAHELVRKTNQFNLSLLRLSESELSARIGAADAGIVTIRLSDRLSDSGLVGVVSGKVEGADLRVDVIAVSCRALGRRLEDTMLTQALRLLAADRPVARIAFAVEDGPRNQPARGWLESYLADCGERIDERAFAMPVAALGAKALSDAVTVEVR